MSKALPSFQIYQRDFTAYIRDPGKKRPPDGLKAEAMDVYAEIVFNTIETCISPCFPVCRAILGEQAWTELLRHFFRDHSSSTPVFREIPQEFMQYVQGRSDLVLPIRELVHYEWVELAVSTSNPVMPTLIDGIRDTSLPMLDSILFMNPTLQNLTYRFPVHRISPRVWTESLAEEDTRLLVYRDQDFEVKFIEINPITSRMVGCLQQHRYTANEVLRRMAGELPQLPWEKLVQFGTGILLELKKQGIVLG